MLFNDRAAWEGVAEFAGEFVEHVPDANVEGFTEHAVAAIQSGDDLGVPARNVQQNWIIAVAFPTSDFDVSHAMIDANEGDVMRGSERSSNARTHLQTRTHARSLRKRDTAEVRQIEGMTFEQGVQQRLCNIAVMICSFSGVNAAFRGTDGIDRRGKRGAITLYGSEG